MWINLLFPWIFWSDILFQIQAALCPFAMPEWSPCMTSHSSQIFEVHFFDQLCAASASSVWPFNGHQRENPLYKGFGAWHTEDKWDSTDAPMCTHRCISSNSDISHNVIYTVIIYQSWVYFLLNENHVWYFKYMLLTILPYFYFSRDLTEGLLHIMQIFTSMYWYFYFSNSFESFF